MSPSGHVPDHGDMRLTTSVHHNSTTSNEYEQELKRRGLALPVYTNERSIFDKIRNQGRKLKGEGAAALWKLGAMMRGEASPKYDRN